MADRTVLVVGGGGREHALCMALSSSSHVEAVHCAPGNGGTSELATNHAISASDLSSLVELAKRIDASLVVVGPEAPLCDALADKLSAIGIPCFGPVQALAELEGSKLHAKNVMRIAGVPTADFHVLDANSDIQSALDDFQGQPWVVKRDVLAGGKGVVVTSDRNEAQAFIESSIQSDGRVLLEAFLQGEEASMLVVMDGSGFVCLPPSQDHKRAYNGDEGPNTGGMGAYSPAPVVDKVIYQRVMDEVIYPTIQGMAAEGNDYTGFLYAGLMIMADGTPKVIEYNCRFGDPETQPILLRLKSDLVGHCQAALSADLDKQRTDWDSRPAVGVVLAAGGYPGSYRTGDIISGLPSTSSGAADAKVFHAGTAQDGDAIVTSGGRVICATAMGGSVSEAQQNAYRLASSIHWDDVYSRDDIAWRAIERETAS